jgi:hypothetical protein
MQLTNIINHLGFLKSDTGTKYIRFNFACSAKSRKYIAFYNTEKKKKILMTIELPHFYDSHFLRQQFNTKVNFYNFHKT